MCRKTKQNKLKILKSKLNLYKVHTLKKHKYTRIKYNNWKMSYNLKSLSHKKMKIIKKNNLKV